MTLASDIITRAYRETNLVPLVSAPNANQVAEALPMLNEQFLAALGFEAGVDLSELNVGGQYDQSAYCTPWVPENVRMVLNLAGPTTLNLHPQPYEGQRLSVADALGNLGTYNLTLSGNGRKIEGATSLVLNTNGTDRQWLYRADTANWVKITALASSDTMPLPTEFDSFFTTRLAMRINPRYGQGLSPETTAELKTIEGKLRARYRKPRPPQDMPSRFLATNRGSYYGSYAGFLAGRC